MGQDVESTVINLQADVNGLKAALFDAQKAMDKNAKAMEDRLAEFSKKTDENLGFFRLAWAGAVGDLASDALRNAISLGESAVSSFLKTGIDGAKEDEVAFNRLNRALESAGLVSEETRKSMEEFAQAEMLVTTHSDDQVASVAALIETIGRLDKDSLKRATKAALDLSAAYNVDLQTATTAVGKAIEGNITSLQKMGIEITKGTTNAQTFANALAKIEEHAGGAAERETTTYAGAVAQLSVAYQEAAESLGKAVTQSPLLIDTIHKITSEIRDLGSWFDNNRSSVQQWVATGINFGAFALYNFTAVVHGAQKALAFLESQFESKQGYEAALKHQRELDAEYDQFQKKVWDVGMAAYKASQGLQQVYGPPSPGIKGLNDKLKTTHEDLKHIKTAAEEAGLALMKSLNSEDSKYGRKKEAVGLDASTDDAAEYNRKIEEMRQVEQAHAMEQLKELAAARATFRDDDVEAERNYTNAKIAVMDQLHIKEDALNKQRDKREKDDQKRRAENVKGSLGIITGLMSSNSKELFAIGKAAALAQATIDGIAAVQKAWDTPFPLNIALTGLVAAATAVNLDKIASTAPPQFASGIDSVPGIGFGDKFPALLEPKERVVPKKTNEDLTAFLDRQKGGHSAPPILNITVQVMGNVYDRRETGLIMVEAINEAIRANGVRFLKGAVA